MDVGLVSAFVGGILALLSPCAALLLPAFFASSVGHGARLLAHGSVFYAGLLIVLVPLGVAAGSIGAVLATHRPVVVLVSSAVLIVLGVVQILGYGFDASRLLPGTKNLSPAAARSAGWAKTFLLGAASGTAGFCAGPILGAVLTLAAARGEAIAAGALLAVYGAGMVAPLLAVALLWNRLGHRGQRVLRGQSFRVLGYPLHTTSVITGTLVLGVGVLFWTTNGLLDAPELIPVSTQAWLQQHSARLTDPRVDAVAVLAVMVIVLGVWWLRRSRAPRPR